MCRSRGCPRWVVTTRSDWQTSSQSSVNATEDPSGDQAASGRPEVRRARSAHFPPRGVGHGDCCEEGSGRHGGGDQKLFAVGRPVLEDREPRAGRQPDSPCPPALNRDDEDPRVPSGDGDSRPVRRPEQLVGCRRETSDHMGGAPSDATYTRLRPPLGAPTYATRSPSGERAGTRENTKPPWEIACIRPPLRLNAIEPRNVPVATKATDPRPVFARMPAGVASLEAATANVTAAAPSSRGRTRLRPRSTTRRNEGMRA